MAQLSADTKHHILLGYSPHRRSHSFAALAERHHIAGGRKTLQRWHDRWDGTAASLEREAGSGRARALSRVEVTRHIHAPLLAANRAHRAVHYPDLMEALTDKTGKEVSLRTVQRYGQQELRAHDVSTVKRTEAERQLPHTVSCVSCSMLRHPAADSSVQSRLTCVSRSQT